MCNFFSAGAHLIYSSTTITNSEFRAEWIDEIDSNRKIKFRFCKKCSNFKVALEFEIKSNSQPYQGAKQFHCYSATNQVELPHLITATGIKIDKNKPLGLSNQEKFPIN